MHKFIVFTVGGEAFGLEIGRMSEVVKPRGIRHVPDVPPYVPGVMFLRGEPIPLMDLRLRMGVAPAQGGRPRVLIVRCGGMAGLIVDQVRAIVDYEEQEIRPAPGMFKGLSARYMMGIAGGEREGAVILLDLDAFLGSEDVMHLETARTEGLRAEEAR